MSTTGRSEERAPAASDVAGRLREASFVRLIGGADGDALAALGLLGAALRADHTPFQASIVPRHERATRATDADCTVALGRGSPDADLTLGVGSPASPTAYEAASTLGSPDAELALVGTIAAGAVPAGTVLEDARTAGIERRPGLAIPTADPTDGLAHSTLVHGPFSGDLETADGFREELAEGDDGRRLASLVALAVAGEDASTVRAAEAVERFLRPFAGRTFETVGGYADVLDAVAREAPGIGLALALGSGDPEAALAAWRDHGRRAHAAVREASTGRYEGLFVARCPNGAPVGTVARLLAAYRSPEPLVLVVAGGEAAAIGSDGTVPVDEAMNGAASAVGGRAGGSATRARASFEGEDTEFVVAFRGAR